MDKMNTMLRFVKDVCVFREAFSNEKGRTTPDEKGCFIEMFVVCQQSVKIDQTVMNI
jgi:hypothetical protein